MRRHIDEVGQANRLPHPFFLLLIAATGCGYVGEPLPPLANIPARVTDLSATEHGNRILVQFTLPDKTTEALPIHTPLQLDLRIGPSATPLDIGNWAASAKKVEGGTVTKSAARFEIPVGDWVGKEVVLAVRTSGPNGKTSDWSNPFSLVAVPPPQPPTAVRADPAPTGVLLTWTAPPGQFRIWRRMGTGEETVAATVDQNTWTDTTAQIGEQYSYRVQSIVKAGENRQAESDLSAAAEIVPKDVFPPATPGGLRALPSPNSIELSWDRNTEPDLAGYRIYRSEGGGAFARIAEVALPAYSDRAVQPDKRYQYQISAFDASGNESPRSAPAEAALQ